MITGRIVGGLGNQLFQIFALLAYSIQYKVKAVFVYEEIVTGRITYWNSFFKNLVIFTTKFAPNNISNEQIVSLPKYQEPGFEYRAFPEFKDLVFIQGYFQSYKYFEAVKDQIYGLLKLENLKTNVIDEYSGYFDDEITTISMHFRLGDYKQKRYYHPVMKYEYYESSLRHIIEKLQIEPNNKVRVLYFCEAEDNVFVTNMRIRPLQNVFPNIEFMKVDDQIADWKQLLIMSNSQHFIMANSTFSWWGAYLGSFPDKIICYPSKWFGEYYEHNYKCDDLMPESWVKIDATSTPWDELLV
jgi:Glycosyl transferase family 11